MKGRVDVVLVAVLSIATVAVGLRIGAGDTLRAAIVMGASVSGGHAAWQLRTQEDDGHTRTATPMPFVATIRTHDTSTVIEGVTNVDGAAELAFDRPGLASGDAVDVTVVDGKGAELAKGRATWPKTLPAPDIAEHAVLRPSRADGTLRMTVAVLGGALAPDQPGRVWVITSSAGEPPRNPRIEATPDLGIEVAREYAPTHDPACPRSSPAGVIEVTARGHSGGIALHAKDDLGREGDWYGALPIAPGAMHVVWPIVAEGPLHVTVTSASAQTLAYLEVDDASGRAEAYILTLTGEPPRAQKTLDFHAPGRSFLVVSGDADGATSVSGATRALPLWVGPSAPCELDLAETTGRAFPRFVALDGFDAKRRVQAYKRKRGRLIALGGIGLGSFLETLLLLRAAREGRRAPTAPKRSALDLLVVLVLSLLGFVLLFALIEWTSS